MRDVSTRVIASTAQRILKFFNFEGKNIQKAPQVRKDTASMTRKHKFLANTEVMVC